MMFWILLILSVLHVATLVVVGLIRYDQLVRKGQHVAVPTPAQAEQARDAIAVRVLATGAGRALLQERFRQRLEQQAAEQKE